MLVSRGKCLYHHDQSHLRTEKTMPIYEYTVVPAPIRGERAKGLKTPTDRFALALTGEINKLAAQGWEYLRAETLPSEERSGLTGRNTTYHNLLIFRRETVAPDAAPAKPVAQIAAPDPAPAPAAAAPEKEVEAGPFNAPSPELAETTPESAETKA